MHHMNKSNVSNVKHINAQPKLWILQRQRNNHKYPLGGFEGISVNKRRLSKPRTTITNCSSSNNNIGGHWRHDEYRKIQHHSWPWQNLLFCSVLKCRKSVELYSTSNSRDRVEKKLQNRTTGLKVWPTARQLSSSKNKN